MLGDGRLPEDAPAFRNTGCRGIISEPTRTPRPNSIGLKRVGLVQIRPALLDRPKASWLDH